MAKFKVGDRVNYARGLAADLHNCDGGRKILSAERGAYRFEGGGLIDIATGDNVGGNYELKLVAPPSPIRTVTKREIVAGQYGKIKISKDRDGLITLDCFSQFEPHDLRAAATLFNELADVLDENTKETA